MKNGLFVLIIYSFSALANTCEILAVPPANEQGGLLTALAVGALAGEPEAPGLSPRQNLELLASSDRELAKFKRIAFGIVKNTALADEAVQQAFLKALSAIDRGKFNGLSTVKTWLTRIVVRESINIVRAQIRKPEMKFGDYKDEEGVDPHANIAQGWSGSDVTQIPDPLGRITGIEITRLLHEAVERLPVDFRQVIKLHKIEEMSFEDTAKKLNINVNTVKSRSFRGLRQLQEILNELTQGRAAELLRAFDP